MSEVPLQGIIGGGDSATAAAKFDMENQVSLTPNPETPNTNLSARNSKRKTGHPAP